jgi:hypothetical protein
MCLQVVANSLSFPYFNHPLLLIVRLWSLSLFVVLLFGYALFLCPHPCTLSLSMLFVLFIGPLSPFLCPCLLSLDFVTYLYPCLLSLSFDSLHFPCHLSCPLFFHLFISFVPSLLSWSFSPVFCPCPSVHVLFSFPSSVF